MSHYFFFPNSCRKLSEDNCLVEKWRQKKRSECDCNIHVTAFRKVKGQLGINECEPEDTLEIHLSSTDMEVVLQVL